MVVDAIAFFVSSVILMFAYGKLLRAFFEDKRVSSIIIISLYVVFFVLLNIQNIFWYGELYPLYSFITVPMLFAISLCYKTPVMKALFVAFYCLFTHTAIRSVAHSIVVINPFAHVNPDTIIHIITSMLLYMTAIWLKRFKYIKKSNTYFRSFWALSLLIVVAMLIYMLDHRGTISTAFVFWNLSYGHIFTLAMLGIAAVIPYLYNSLASAFEERLQNALYTQERKYYFSQFQLMHESVENIKTIRHDMKFHLATIMDFTSNNKVGEATSYLNGLLGDIEQKEVYSNTKNVVFDSIINFKLNDTKQENIKLEIRLLIPPNLNIEVADVVTILGNLLDNAIDAVAKVEDKIIKLDIEYSKKSLFIQIENSFDGEVNYVKGRNGAEKVITTRKEGSNHGYGIKSIRKALEKYNGYMDIDHNDDMFSVGVLLYVEG